eukprot:CAMPEP_0113551338 /NCGR_PEP_ID=MMETSP0015_2-20120614/14470_1 /TAXON_ID=2838 /ORGANISM="Odontella" /LENGTH=268 /DNA_ID=CAMNT_0000452221 /DNA_START=35 /DNA_END=844 /DNA_ORIENTATION=- /assembly_acc=CAM_ASM_000160
MTSSSDLLSSHDGQYGAAGDHFDVENDASNEWHFTDFGHVGDLSRDGSPHATDEVVNAASHLAASMFSLLGTVILIAASSAQGEPWKIVSFSIYGASLLFLFVCSTLHHSITASPKVEERLRMLDYLAIYPLIAGTFTPMCLVFYHNSYIGWTFCSVVWALAILGMMATAHMFRKIPKWMSMTMYITMGWLGAFMTYWLIPMIGIDGMGVFILGGLFYTGGGFIYSTEKPNPIPGRFGFHEIWHIAVMLGAACHWCMMYFYVLPWTPP